MQSIGHIETKGKTAWDELVNEVRALIKSGKKYPDMQSRKQQKAYHWLMVRHNMGLEDLSVEVDAGTTDDVVPAINLRGDNTPPTSTKQEPTIEPRDVKRGRGEISESPPNSNKSNR
jgi:hypothetical protein